MKKGSKRKSSPHTTRRSISRSQSRSHSEKSGESATRSAVDSTSVSPNSSKVRFAVVGLGYIAQAAVLPAFAHARKECELSALVSGDAKKLKELGARYNVKNLFSYEEYAECLRSGLVDAVYIALPNSFHRDAVILAAENGVHSLCEKPMAVTVADCEAMNQACAHYGVRLMIAYRLHFEAANRAVVDTIQEGVIGEPIFFSSNFAMQIEDENIRLDRSLGGGPLFDIGIYCINAARNIFRAEPRAVVGTLAWAKDARFKEVETTAAGILHFGGGRLATFTSSFGAADCSTYEIVGSKGTLRVTHAFEWQSPIVVEIKSDGKSSTRTFKKRDQFAPELIHFANCIREGKEVHPSGEEGLADVRVIEALYESAGRGQLLELGSRDKEDLADDDEVRREPSPGKVPLVNAHAPSQ